MRTPLVAVVLTALVLVLAPAAFAASERITIDADKVPFRDLLALLEKQTGWRLQMVGGQDGADTPVTVKADDQPAKKVLRSACEQAGFNFRRLHGDNFWVQKGDFKESPFAATVEGFRVSIESMQINGGSHHASFSSGSAEYRPSPPRTYMQLAVETDTIPEADLIQGILGLAVTDDTDAAYAPLDRPAKAGGLLQMQSQNRPDQGVLGIPFPLPAKGAKHLVVAGKLALYTRLEPLEIRFDDITAKNVTQKSGDITVTLRECRINGRGVNFSYEVTGLPRFQPNEPTEWTGAAFVFINADGGEHALRLGTYFQGGSGSYGSGLPEGFTPKSLVFRISKRIGPVRELPFKIENVPLPGAEPEEKK